MKTLIITIAIAGTLLSSCDSSKKDEKYSFKDSTGLNMSNSTSPATVNPVQPIQPNLQPQTVPVTVDNKAINNAIQSVIPPVNLTQTPTTVTAPGMNPPHGQPGHRCDIKEGAPLNSKPGKPVVTTTSSQPVPTPTTNQPVVVQQPTSPTLPGMNPPHGQPNHRCDIAVGAPLNSKPAAPVTATQTPQPVVAQQPTAPTLPGMNPPHGQPGHRCEIAVGAPLSSAPIKKDSVAH